MKKIRRQSIAVCPIFGLFFVAILFCGCSEKSLEISSKLSSSSQDGQITSIEFNGTNLIGGEFLKVNSAPSTLKIIGTDLKHLDEIKVFKDNPCNDSSQVVASARGNQLSDSNELMFSETLGRGIYDLYLGYRKKSSDPFTCFLQPITISINENLNQLQVSWMSLDHPGRSASPLIQISGTPAISRVKLFKSANCPAIDEISAVGDFVFNPSYSGLEQNTSILPWGEYLFSVEVDDQHGNLKCVNAESAFRTFGESPIVQVFSGFLNSSGAIRADGSAVFWGANFDYGNFEDILKGTVPVINVFGNSHAYGVILQDGSVHTWGNSAWGGDSSSVATSLNGTIDVISVAAGNGSFAALRADGSVVTWGDSNYGGDSSAVAASIDGTVDVVQLTYGAGAFAALRADGSLVTWGVGYGGNVYSSPLAAELDGTVDVVEVVANNAAMAVVRSDGSLVTWGSPTYGGDSSSVTGSFTKVFKTLYAFAGLRSDGSVVTWGSATHGGDSSSVSTELNGTTDVLSIDGNDGSFAALRADGSVVTWGVGLWGGDSSSVSLQLNGSVDVVTIVGKIEAFAALRADGSVVTWGRYGTNPDVAPPVMDGTIDVISIVANTCYTCAESAFAALRADGSVLTWGSQGLGGDSSSVSPEISGVVNVTSLYATGVGFVALREDGSIVKWPLGYMPVVENKKMSREVALHSVFTTSAGGVAALLEDGSVSTWGSANNGGNSRSVETELNGAIDVVQIFSTAGAFAALRVDGSVITWGDVYRGGNSSSVATQMNGNVKVISITSNDHAFAALREDGSVVTWGCSGSGCGNYGGDSSAVATELNGAIKVVSITPGSLAFAALREDGSVVAWGESSYGGDSSVVAADLDGTVDVSKLESSGSYFKAYLADGRLRFWGENSIHQNMTSISQARSTYDTYTENASGLLVLHTNGSLSLHSTNPDFFTENGLGCLASTFYDGSVAVTEVFAGEEWLSAVRVDGSVIRWPYQSLDGCAGSGLVPGLDGASPISEVFLDENAVVVLRDDGSIFAFGDSDYGGDISAVASQLDGSIDVVKVVRNQSGGYAALRADGSVITWGRSDSGGDGSAVASKINGAVKVNQIFSFEGLESFAALREDGSFVAWGGVCQNSPVYCSDVKSQIDGTVDVIAVLAPKDLSTVFLKRADGSVISFGQGYYSPEGFYSP